MERYGRRNLDSACEMDSPKEQHGRMPASSNGGPKKSSVHGKRWSMLIWDANETVRRTRFIVELSGAARVFTLTVSDTQVPPDRPWVRGDVEGCVPEDRHWLSGQVNAQADIWGESLFNVRPEIRFSVAGAEGGGSPIAG